MHTAKRCIPILIAVWVCGYGVTGVSAQTSSSEVHIPLIGITSVPDPLALPEGPGAVTYHYAVKNFLAEAALTGVNVVDDTCNPVIFIEGDDNGDLKLDYSETWRYICTAQLSTTTQSIVTATGAAHALIATHKAYATVVVGSNNPAPLVSIVNITKVAYPLSLPAEGGPITFTYRVNNPGMVPLDHVVVTDDKCNTMSGRLGDTNGNNLLDVNEVWIYSCAAQLQETTTNTGTVTAFANNLRAVGSATITVKVAAPDFPDLNIRGSAEQSIPSFPETGENANVKITIWAFLAGILAALIIVFVMMRTDVFGKTHKKYTSP